VWTYNVTTNEEQRAVCDGSTRGGQVRPLDLAKANTANGDGCIRFTDTCCESIADA
jgi:hypothetical protein